MLKYEEAEEQYKPVDIPTRTTSQEEATERLVVALAAQEGTRQVLDKQEGYADKLMATVQTEARKFRKHQAMTRSVAVCFGILMGLMVLVFIAHGLMRGKWDWDMLTSMTGMTGVIGMAAASSKTLKSAASELSTIEDLRAIGPLVESLEIEEKSVRLQVEKALIRLLPRLQASDAGLLNAEQRAYLNKALYGKNNELIIAILRAYEQVGDETALPVVEALARKTSDNAYSEQTAGPREASLNALLGPKASTSYTTNIAEAAQACLPALRLRVEQQRASQTLLRGSSAMEVAPDTLLRAAQATADAQPEQLLRPAGNG